MNEETIGVAEITEIVGDKRQRGISEAFEGQLTDGVLQPVLERLRRDDTLSLEIRNGYIDIYYRGGRADYYVARVQHTGYALFAENMKPLDKFVAKLHKRDQALPAAV